MLSDSTAAHLFSTTPRVPEFLLANGGLRRIDNSLQHDFATHTEADDISFYIVGATGITYAEAVVTLSSEISITKPVGHTVLVPLRVLRLLTSINPNHLNEYTGTFERDHLDDVFQLIHACRVERPAPRLFFSTDESPPWDAMLDICVRLGLLIVAAELPTSSNIPPSNGGMFGGRPSSQSHSTSIGGNTGFGAPQTFGEPGTLGTSVKINNSQPPPSFGGTFGAPQSSVGFGPGNGLGNYQSSSGFGGGNKAFGAPQTFSGSTFNGSSAFGTTPKFGSSRPPSSFGGTIGRLQSSVGFGAGNGIENSQRPSTFGGGNTTFGAPQSFGGGATQRLKRFRDRTGLGSSQSSSASGVAPGFGGFGIGAAAPPQPPLGSGRTDFGAVRNSPSFNNVNGKSNHQQTQHVPPPVFGKPSPPPPLPIPGAGIGGSLFGGKPSTKGAAAPRHFDVVRTDEVRYVRGFELIRAYVRDFQVIMQSRPLPRVAAGLLTKYSIKLGPLGEFGVKRQKENGEDGGDGMAGLNELIQDVNDGIQAPARWLLSHVLCGRIAGSNAKGSKTSWFPRRSLDGQFVHVSLSLRRITDNVGPLLWSSQGNVVVLPSLGCGDVANLIPLNNVRHSSLVHAVWRAQEDGERFEPVVDGASDIERTGMC